MSIVYACIAPHSGHLLIGKNEPTPIPKSRAAMEVIARDLRAANPETIVVLTPHGVMATGHISLGVARRAFGELDGATVNLETDLDLAASWAYLGAAGHVPITPLVGDKPDTPFPLDWGVVIPVVLTASDLDPAPRLIAACPARDVSRDHLVKWGEALAEAAVDRSRRVALIVSADQGHGHAADGPYGFTSESAAFDAAMVDAVSADDLPRLLGWPEDWPEAALADSYWQTLCLIGVQKRVPLKARFLSYEIDHYFGLICASFTAAA